MAGNILEKYVSSVTPTVTSLQSLASSQDWTAGWGSATITNNSNNYQDYLLGATITTNSANRQAGSINIYIIGSLNDTPLFPASASGTIGTEGAISFTDTEERDSACRLLTSITVDTTASAVMPFGMTSIAQLFGRMPSHFVIFVAQNASTTTTAGLASSGNALYYTPIYQQYT